jgi:hypothetical protein
MAILNFSAFIRTPFINPRTGTLTKEAVSALVTAEDRIGGTTGGIPASEIVNAPNGTIAAITVQSALDELDAEKATAAALTAGLATKQPLDDTLTAVAGVTTAANRLIYWTGVDAAAATDFTAFARTLLDDANASTARSTLGVGTIGTQDADNVNITGGDIALASGTVGYAAGNGGAVVQLLTKATGVTLDTPCGAITMNNGGMAAGTTATFTLTNSTIAAGDVLILGYSGGTDGAYRLNFFCSAGSADISVTNTTAGVLSEAIVISFAVFKAATT